MTIIYTNEWVINLTHLKLTFEEVNGWVSNEIGFAKYAVPFTVKWNADSEFLRTTLSTKFTKVYQAYLKLEGVLRKARLEILSYNNIEVECTIYYGVDELPGNDKLLKDFDFPEITVANIFDHMENVTAEDYTAHFYNFPKVIRPYDNNLEAFSDYSGFVNDYYDPLSYDVDNAVVRPYLYLNRVIKHCFEQLNFNVSGSFFDDHKINSALLVSGEEFHFIGGGVVNSSFVMDDLVETYFENGVEMQFFRKEIDPSIVDYGNIKMSVFVPGTFATASAELSCFCNGTLLGSVTHLGVSSSSLSPDVLFLNPTLTNDQIGRKLVFELRITKSWTDENIPNKFKINIKALSTGSSASILPLQVVNPNFININNLLPQNMTFGELFSKIESSFKVVKRIVGNSITIDLPRHAVANRSLAVDLRQFETGNPFKSAESLQSFELKFSNLNEYEEKNYIGKAFIDASGFKSEDYVLHENTTEISVDFRPLFFNTLNDVYTAEIIDGKTTGVMFYNYNERPLLPWNVLSSITEWYAEFFKDYFKINLDPEYLNISFLVDHRTIGSINNTTLFYMYGSYYLVKEVTKNQMDEYYYNYEIEGVRIPNV